MSWKNIMMLTLVLGLFTIGATCCPLEKYVHPVRPG